MTVDSARDKESCVQVIINCDKESDILHTQLEQCTVSVCVCVRILCVILVCMSLFYIFYIVCMLILFFIFQAAAS